MSLLSAWVLSIVGIVVLGVLIDVIIPEGQTHKYIKSVFAIVTVFVIASPIPKLINGEFVVGDIFPTYQENVVDEGFVDYITQSKINVMQKQVQKEIEDYGVSNAQIVIEAKQEEGKFVVDEITIDLSKSVINEKLANINIENEITSLVCKMLNIKKEQIKVYGGK